MSDPVSLPLPGDDETPPEDAAASSGLSTPDEFGRRVTRILELIREKPETRDRLLAEVYVQMAEASTFFREMQADFGRLGPGGILKMLRGKG